MRSGYETPLKAAEDSTALPKTSAGVAEQQQQIMRMSSLLAAIETLARQAASEQAAPDGVQDGLIQAAEGDTNQPITRPTVTTDPSDTSVRACVV
jgi:hypothetical protein